MPRIRQTLSDYVVIAISPALIMFMVGSFTLYLSEVFYRGGFGNRINFILCMFVMGAVCIGRLSVEEGVEHATVFGAPLAIVTAMAVWVFISPVLPGLVLIGLIWYATHKLTWDCTVIDESEDASGEGLLQTAGMGERRREQPTPETAAELLAAEQASDLEATSGGETDAKEPSTLWEKWCAYRRRPHAHGLWVIYFSLAALPIFGVGQWFIPSSNTVSRGICFRMLLTYVACALALLMTTSFLSLRRYLRQRRLAMPMEMTAAWFTSGCVLIAVLLLVCTILPRRNPLFSMAEEFSDTSFFATSRVGLRSSDYAMMNSDAIDDSQSGSGERGEGQSSGERRDSSKSGSGGDQKSGGKQSGGKQSGGKQSGGKQSGGKQSGGKQSGGKQSGGKQSGGKQSGGKQSGGKQSGGKQSGGKQSGGKQSGGKQSGGKQSGGKQSGGKQSGGKQSGGKQSGGKQSGNGEGAKGGEGSKGEQERDPNNRGPRFNKGKSDQSEKQNSEPKRSDSPSNSGQRSQPKDSQSSKSSRSSNSSRSNNATSRPRSSSSSNFLSSLGAGFRALLKLAYYVVIFGVVIYFAWKYRDQVKDAIVQFIAKLRELWERLFGGREAVEEEAEAATAKAPRQASFSDFDDPFVSGAFRQMGPDGVTRISFQALQAWARDQGIPRNHEQTPIEFAAGVAREFDDLKGEAKVLADTYCRLAYANQSATEEILPPMQSLWRKMKQQQAVAMETAN